MLICLSSSANEIYKYEVEQKISYNNVYTVTLKNRAGNIEIEAYDQQQISVKIIKNINASNEQVANDYAQKIELKTERLNDTLSIEATLPERPSESIDSVYLDYKIKAPGDIALKIDNENGNVIVKGIYGEQEIEAFSGDVELVKTVGKFSVKTNNGDISGSVLLNGENKFYTVRGDISIEIWDAAFYPTTAETVKGSITFSLPPGFSAELKASAPEGTFSCNLPASITRREDSLIEGVINNGGPLLHLSALSGDININRLSRKEDFIAEKAEEKKPPASDMKKQRQVQDTEDIDLMPILDFNRVQGFVLGGAVQASTVQAGGGRIYGSLEYGWSNEVWNYQFGAEKSWFDKHKIAIGSEIYKITDTNDTGLLSESESLLSTVLFGEAFSDYFLRKGYKSWLSMKLTPSTRLEVQYNNDEYSPLFKMTDWSLLNPELPKPFNRRIDAGILKSITFSYLFDSRDVKKHNKRNDFRLYAVPCQDTKNGWLGNISVEYAGKDLESDFNYTLYQFNITRYNRISSDHAFDFRIKGSLSTEKLPRQKLFYLGGIGTIRGYDFKEFAGDNMLLINLEYSLKISQHIWSLIFLDSGYTFFYDQKANLDNLHSSAGLGIKISIEDQSVIGYIAQPVERNRGPGLIVRLERMF